MEYLTWFPSQVSVSEVRVKVRRKFLTLDLRLTRPPHFSTADPLAFSLAKRS